MELITKELQHPSLGKEPRLSPEPDRLLTLGPPPALDSLADLKKAATNGDLHLGTRPRSRKGKVSRLLNRTKLPVITPVTHTAAEEFAATKQPQTPEQVPSKVIELSKFAAQTPQQLHSKAIEFSRWRDKLLNPRVALEREVCLELERELLPDEKRRWDEFRQYLRSLAGDNAENKAESQAFQPFQNRTRLSWRVVEIAEDIQATSSSARCDDIGKRVPYICIEGVRTRENAQRLHTFLSKRKARAEYYPPFKLCYSLAHIRAPASKTELFIQKQPSEFTLCGSLATKDGERFTIGGLVQIGSDVFALSSRHSTVPELKDGSEESTDELMEKLKYSSEFDEDIDPALILEADSPVLNLSGTDQRARNAQEASNNEKLSEEALTELVGDVAYVGTEWRLFSVDNAFQRLANCIEVPQMEEDWESPAIRRIYFDKIATEAIKTAVVIMGGESGQVHAHMSPNATDILLPSGEVLEVWRIRFENNSQGIRHGDSGSWVLDPENGVVFGHIIAMTDVAAYVLPLRDIFQEINRQVVKGTECHLVSAFECFASLAALQSNFSLRRSLFAQEALSQGVLDRSSTTPSVSLLRSYLKLHERSQDEREALSDLLMATGPDLARSIMDGDAIAMTLRNGCRNRNMLFKVVQDLVEVLKDDTRQEATVQQADRVPISKAHRRRVDAKVLDYDNEDLYIVASQDGDGWSSYSKSRFNRRADLLNAASEPRRALILRELQRVAFNREYFRNYRLSKRGHYTLLGDLAVARSKWRESAVTRVTHELLALQERSTSEPYIILKLNRDKRIMREVQNWGLASGHESQKVSNPRAETLSALDDNSDTGPYSLNADHEASLIAWDKGMGGVSIQNEFIHGIFPHQKLSVEDLLRGYEGGPVKRSEGKGRIQYFHFPANHMGWIEDFMSAYYTGSVGTDRSHTIYKEKVKQISLTAKEGFPWCGEYRHGRQVPIYARQMSSHCSGRQSTPFKPKEVEQSTRRPSKYVAFFMPYLHWEDERSLQQARRYVDLAKSQMKAQVDSFKSRSPDGKYNVPMAFRPNFVLPTRGTQDASSWQPHNLLARYLFYAAKVYQLFSEAAEARLVLENIVAPSPLHMRRTLAQFGNWPSADIATGQDRKQTVNRQARRQRDTLGPYCPLVVVDQLWLWVLDDNTIVSSFPKQWGSRSPQDPADIHKNIASRIGALCPDEVDNAYDIALIIIEECSKALLRPVTDYTSGPDMLGLYSSALTSIGSNFRFAYDWFDDITHKSRRDDTLASLEQMLRRSQISRVELVTAEEAAQAVKELEIMEEVFTQQLSSMDQLGNFLQKLNEGPNSSHPGEVTRINTETIERISTIVAGMKHRRSELEHMENLQRIVETEIWKLQELKQQYVHVIRARMAIKGEEEAVLQRRSIIAFTVITLIFLPISFLAAFFGMNSAGRLNISFNREVLLTFIIGTTVTILFLLVTYSARVRATLSLLQAYCLHPVMIFIQYRKRDKRRKKTLTSEEIIGLT